LRILIVGGGKVAEYLLSYIDLREHQVYLVERDPDRRAELSSKYDIFVIGKDATDVTLYTSDLEMDSIDAVLALTGSDETNIFTLAIAKLYNIPYRIAKVSDPRLADLLYELGLGTPITQPSLIASFINSYLSSVVSMHPLMVGGDYSVYLISIAETDPVSRMQIKDLKLPETVKILLLFDGKTLRPPLPDDRLLPGFQLVVLSREKDTEKYFKG
jgi:trk system potassium uptake protein TrkA